MLVLHERRDYLKDSTNGPESGSFESSRKSASARPTPRDIRDGTSGNPVHDSESIMQPDRVQLHVLYRDTKYRLHGFREAVREGRHLDEAAGFARFVLNSGLCAVLAQFPQADPLPCDGHLLRGFAQDLLAAVQERWRTGNTKPEVELSELQAIRRNLDLIAGQVARMTPRVPVPVPEPLQASYADVTELPTVNERAGQPAARSAAAA